MTYGRHVIYLDCRTREVNMRDKRIERLAVRVSTKEKKKLEAQATKNDMKLSEFIRYCVLQKKIT